MYAAHNKITKIENGTIVTPKGFQTAGLHSGVKRRRNDLGMIYCETPANAAAVYTMNVIQAAPLDVTKNSIAKEGRIQALIVNSGNANACTGKQGEKDAYDMRKNTADHLSIAEHYVAVASTGIIGLDMPMDTINAHIPKLKLGSSHEHADNFNESILTTDVSRKSTGYQAVIDGKVVKIGGSAKGSGMIEPRMGTMLGFITTDLNIDSDLLQGALKEVVDKTFNCITVDGDTSTNDMVLTMASGLAGNDTLTKEHEDWPVFIALLQAVCEDLAKMIASDGEGATKLIEVEVSGAKTNNEAIKVAKSVVGSALVKTAIYGEDANWGRIIAAIGYSDAYVDPHTIDTKIGDIQLLENSQPLSFSEEEASAYLANETIKIDIDLHVGEGTGKAWGCDLTYDYVRINASYRS